MNHKEIVRAITFIRPGAEFSLSGNQITWYDKKQTEPTKAEIEAGWVAYQAAEKAESEAQAQGKAAAQAKLAALGLTVEDLQALGL